MGGLSPALQALVRSAIARATDTGADLEVAAFPLAPTASLRRMTSVPDGMGGTTTTEATYATGVAVRIETGSQVGVSTQESTGPNMPGVEIPWALTFPLGTDVTATTTVLLSDGRIFEVVAMLGPSSHSPSLRVGAREIL